jgi:hypothetical protein
MPPLLRSGRFLITMIVIVILVLIILGLNNRVAELRTLSQEAVRYEERVQSLQHTKIALETQMAYATSDPPVIQWAMEDMRWVRDNPADKLVVPLVDPNATPAPLEPEEIEVEAHPVENWQVWLALFFDDQDLP